MFDFDVVTGPTNPTRPAKPGAPPAVAPLTLPAPPPATAIRDDSREAAQPTANPAGSRQ